MEQLSQPDYFEQHRQRLDRLTTAIETRLASARTFRVAIDPAAEPSFIVETPFPVEELLAGEHPMPLDQARDLAARANEGLRAAAQTDRNLLQTWATSMITNRPSQLRRQLVGDTPPALLDYQFGRYRSARIQPAVAKDELVGDIHIARTDLVGIEGDHAAEHFTVELKEPGLERSLRVRTLDGVPRDAIYSVFPEEDAELLMALHAQFGNGFHELMVWTAGSFRNQTELDQGLRRFLQRHGGTADPHIAWQLLAKVRSQAIATHEARKIMPPDAHLPTAEQLDEFTAMLMPS